MASTTCGHCGRLAHMTAASGLHVIGRRYGEHFTQQAVFKCPNCLQLNLVTQDGYGERTNEVYPQEVADKADWTTGHWLPRLGETREFDDVPPHIAQAATEATLCLSVGTYRAVGSLARAVIEATAKDKGITTGNLAAKIDALLEAGHVRKHTAEQAHEIRHFGNDMAHGDFVDPVTEEEAEEVVALMSEVMDEVYQSPARLDRRRAARAARKEQTEGV